MFEVVCSPTGDNAEADTPEAAIVAARTLLREAAAHGCGDPTASFWSDGKFVRGGVRDSGLTGQ